MKPTSIVRAIALCSMVAAASISHAYEMVVSSEVAATHWKTTYMNEFAEKVQERTDGEVVVKVFPAGQLFNDQDALASLGTGSVHMVWPVAVRLETVAPATGLINLPFSMSDDSMANACYSEKVTQLISDQVEPRNLQVLSLLRTADLFFIFRDVDAKNLEDFKGTKLRVTGGRVFLDMIRSLDASPVSMAASEMSTALSQGAIDGIYTSPAGWAEMIGMTGKYAYHVPSLTLATYAVVVDKEWLEALPEEHQAVIADTMTEITQRQWAEARADDARLIQSMEDQGAVYRIASDEVIDQVTQLAQGSVDEFAEKYPEVTQRMEQIVSECGL